MRAFILLAALLMVSSPAGASEKETLESYISWFKREMRPSKQQAALLLVPEILQAAHTHKIDPLLIATTIKAESSFFLHQVGSRGEFGLMQVMGLTHRATVQEQLDAGARILAYSLKRCKTIESAHNNYMTGYCTPVCRKAKARSRHHLWAKKRFSK